MKSKLPALLIAPLALVLLPSCASTPKTPAQIEAAAERREKQATEHIRKVNRGRPRGGGH